MKTEVERIVVEKLVVKVNGKTLELTPAEAKTLHDELCAVLGLCKTPVINITPQIPVYIAPTPIPNYTPHYWPWEITCGTNAPTISRNAQTFGTLQTTN